MTSRSREAASGAEQGSDERLNARESAALRELCLKLISTWVETRMSDLSPQAFGRLAQSLSDDELGVLKTGLSVGGRSAAPRRPSPTAESAPGTTAAIVAAATDIFLAHGYGANVDLIAEAAGISKRTIYSHFDGKDHLFRTVLDQLKFEITARLRWTGSGDVAGELLTYARELRENVFADRILNAFRLVESHAAELPALAEQTEAHTRELIGGLRSYFRKGMDAGAFIEADPAFLAEHFFSMTIYLARARLLHGVKPDKAREDAYLEQEVPLFVRAISVRG